MLNFTTIKDYANDNPGFVSLVAIIVTILLPLSVSIIKIGYNGFFRIISFLISEMSNWNLPIHKNKRRVLRIGSFEEAFDYLPAIVAKRRNYFKQEFSNFLIKYKVFHTYDEIKTAIDNKEVDILFMAVAPSLRLFASGANIKIFDVCCLHTQYLLTRNQAYRRVSDLLGAKITTPKFSSSHFGAIEIMKKCCVDNEAIEWNFGTVNNCLKLFRTGDVDVLGIWPLLAEVELGRSYTKRINGSYASVYSIACVVNKDRESARKISEPAKQSLSLAKAWIYKNKTKAKSLSQWQFHKKSSVVERGWDECDFSIRLDDRSKSDIERANDLMVDVGWFKDPGPEHLKELFLQ